MNTNAQNRLNKGSLISFLGIYALLTVSILWVGYFMYREQEHRVRLNIEHQLAAVAELKTNELVRWREERYRDGVVFYNNPAFTALFNRYLQKPNDAEIHKQLMGWLTKHMDQYHYNQMRLMDVRGTTILSVPGDLDPASSGEIQSFAEILSTGEPSLSDFYRSINNQHIYLAMRVPIIDLEKDKTPIGLLSMRIDPEKFLYPFILKWPTPSTTAETLLVRREGSDVVYLNDLRFYKNAALNLRIPLDRADYLVVQAVLGKTGIVEGTDYRSKAAIADVRSVPGSPWFLVTRIDTKEAFAPATEKLLLFVSLIVALLVLVGFALAFAWRHQQAAFYLVKARTAENLRVMNLDLQQKTAELEVANTELEAFNYTLSHDLRSYLSRISLASETLLETEAMRLTEQGNHLLKLCLASCQSMEDLIATMLHLARISRQDLQHEEVDLSDLARTIGCELSLAEPDRIIHFNIIPGLRVRGDAQMLRVVLENLFGNACKYTKGKEEADISLTASREGSRIVFAVTDNGTGFDMAEADDLFHPFKRLSNASGFPGFGVGLTTVQRIIQRHGGEIWAEAVPNEGATFYFTIPEQAV